MCLISDLCGFLFLLHLHSAEFLVKLLCGSVALYCMVSLHIHDHFLHGIDDENCVGGLDVLLDMCCCC